MNYNQDFAVQSAQIKQDTLNTVVRNPNGNFVRNVKLAALDSFFRFGITETGYAADWQNPKKKNITLNKNDKPEDSLEIPIDIMISLWSAKLKFILKFFGLVFFSLSVIAKSTIF
jgi:hypothetical protein